MIASSTGSAKALPRAAPRAHPELSWLLACAMLSLAFAGCSEPDRVLTPTAATVIGSRCLGAAEGKCELTPDGLYVRDLTLAGSSPNGVGLLVEGLTTNLVLAGLVIRGYGMAVEVGSTCTTCVVEIRDARLEASSVGILAGLRGAVEGGVHLRNVEIVAGSKAVSGFDVPGGLTLDGAVISSPGVSDGRAVEILGAAGTLRASNVTISGFERALFGNWSAIHLRNVAIACVYDAIYAYNFPDFDADGLTIRDCAADVPCEGDCDVFAIQLFGKLFETGDMVRMRHLNLTNYKGGVLLSDYRSVELEDFVLTKGQRGLGVGPWGSLTMRRGVVSEHEVQGVHADVDALTVDRVTFDHNGFRDASESDRGGLIVYADHQRVLDPEGERPLASLEIHNSTFTGNTPFGLLAYGDVFDASFNWWGHSLGPSPPTPEAIGHPKPLGDMACCQAVVTVPHLTAPPSG